MTRRTPRGPRATAGRQPFRALRSTRAGLVAVLAGLIVSGCSAVPNYDPPATPPPVSASVPADGMSLRELGVEYGPIDAVSVPREHELELMTSQINVVTLVFTDPDAGELAEWFRSTLPDAGWTIGADNNDALIFTGHGWDGAFTPLGNGERGGSFSLRKQGQ